jgi:hypothetical protein
MAFKLETDILMDATNKAIWAKFRVKRHDLLPFKGWQGTRETLAELFSDLGFTNGLEVGTSYGKFAKILCTANPSLHLKCVDPWKAYTHHTDEEIEQVYQAAVRNLSGCDVEYIRKTSVEAAKDISDLSLDFVYIDGLHDFDSVMTDIITWVPKVKSGGIVSGHDYYRFYKYGVIPAVDAYTRAHNINMYYMTRENESPSYFWVR